MTPTFEQLDEMAKAIRARLLGRDDEWAVIDEAARMAYRLAARDAWEVMKPPQGYVLVPCEPTDAMIDAGDACDRNPTSDEWAGYDCGEYDWTEIGNAGCDTHWRAMVKAFTGSAQSKRCDETSRPSPDDE